MDSLFSEGCIVLHFELGLLLWFQSFFFQLVQILSEAKRTNKITIQSSDYIIFPKE